MIQSAETSSLATRGTVL